MGIYRYKGAHNTFTPVTIVLTILAIVYDDDRHSTYIYHIRHCLKIYAMHTY